MCSYCEPLFKQKLFFTGKIKFKFFHFQLHLHFFNSSSFIHVFLFSFWVFLQFIFILFFLNFNFSHFYSFNPKIAIQFQIIFTHNSSSTILLRISNFNMAVLTSQFNYLYRSNNSDFLMPQAPPSLNLT